MFGGKKRQEDFDSEELTEVRAELKAVFDSIQADIPLLLFADPGRNDVFSQATRQVIRAFREFTPKITLREYRLDHKEARKWNAEYSPTLLLDPEHYRIRWYGAPIGEEARTFLEAVIMMGHGKADMSEDSRKILRGLDSPREIKLFVSPTCPFCPQQAVNAVKAAVERPDMISLEIIDIQANPDLAEAYSAQSVPQTYANDTLIAMGAQPEELFMLSLSKMEQQSFFIPDHTAEEVEADMVIVGGGPAGLTAGIYGARSGLKTVIIEKDSLGGQMASTPVIENYPGITQVGGKALVDMMVTHALEYVRIFPGEEVVEIRPGKPVEIKTNRRRFTAKAVLLATGAEYRRLDVPGEQRLSGHGVSYCSTCDGPLFKGKKVLMVGGGDSAVTEALHLHHMGVDVTLVHRRDKLRAQEYLVENLTANNIPVMYHAEIKEIKGKDRVEEAVIYNRETGESTTLAVDGIFVAIGYRPVVELAGKIGVEISPEGYIKHDSRHRTNIPGIYSAGDVEGGYKQIVTASGHGSEAALSIFEDLIHPYWKKED